MVIETRGRQARGARRRRQSAAPREWVVTLSVIGAAALATFVALFLTSRPYDPMNSTLEAQQDVPPSSFSLPASPTPSVSPSATPRSPATPTPAEPGAETSPTDDTAIQADIERRIAGDASLSGLAVSTTVEGGRVSVFGSVKSPELKSRVERVVRSIKGVTAVDNQLVVIEPTP